MNLLSAFGGGLIIIPLLTFIGAIICGVLGLKASKSNSTTQTPGGTIDNTGNVAWYKTGYGVFSIILTVVTGVIVIWMYNER